MAFIVRLGRKHPGIPANQALVRFLKVEQSQAEPIDRAGRRSSHPVIDHQPTSRSLDRGRRHANFVGVPPGATTGFQHKLVTSPVPQIGRVRDPDVSAEWRHGPMDQGPESIDPSRQKSCVLVVGRHDDTKSLEAPKILRERQRDARTTAGVRSISHRIFLEFRNVGDAWIFNAP